MIYFTVFHMCSKEIICFIYMYFLMYVYIYFFRFLSIIDYIVEYRSLYYKSVLVAYLFYIYNSVYMLTKLLIYPSPFLPLVTINWFSVDFELSLEVVMSHWRSISNLVARFFNIEFSKTTILWFAFFSCTCLWIQIPIYLVATMRLSLIAPAQIFGIWTQPSTEDLRQSPEHQMAWGKT